MQKRGKVKKIEKRLEKKKSDTKELGLMIKSVQLSNPGIEQNILKTFLICDRKFFMKQSSYVDVPQHVAHGQTISQPSTIARMLRLLRLEPNLNILEVGTNTGYHASLVSWLVWPGQVDTIEIFPDLAEGARKNVKQLIRHLEGTNKREAKKFSKINIFAGDALDQKQEIWQKKYDRIFFTAGVELDKINQVKDMGKKLLQEHGLLLFPTREAWDYGALEIWQLHGESLKLLLRETGYAFVPLLRKQEIDEFYKK